MTWGLMGVICIMKPSSLGVAAHDSQMCVNSGLKACVAVLRRMFAPRQVGVCTGLRLWNLTPMLQGFLRQRLGSRWRA